MKNFIVVDCKAKSEGMIPIEEFKNDDELSKLNVGSTIDDYLERIESARSGEIVLSREKARKAVEWRNIEEAFEAGSPVVGVITDRVKGGFRNFGKVRTSWSEAYKQSQKRETTSLESLFT